jgi:hypothetical protein
MPADFSALRDGELDAVAGGRMKLPTVGRPSQDGQGGAGLPFGEWSLHPNYLGPF